LSDSLLSQAEIDALLAQSPEPDTKPEPGQKDITGSISAPLASPEEQEDAEGQDKENPVISTGKNTAGKKREQHPKLGLILDIPLNITVNLSETEKKLGDILSLSPGAIVEFPRSAGEQVDFLVSGKMVAKGEVVVVDENFAINITRILCLEDRIKKIL